MRRINELGTTVFLTTQYLEEADELADRVGIISRGRLVAEGPPEVLKHSIGQDMIVVETEGETTVESTAMARRSSRWTRPARCARSTSRAVRSC